VRLSRIEEQHPPATLKRRNKNTHYFCQKKKSSLFFTLFFFVGKEKSPRKIESAKKPPYSSQSDDVVKRRRRRRRCSFCAYNTLFFSPFACRPLRRPPSFCARKHRCLSRDEVFIALFLSKRRLWGREKTTTRERPSTQKRERRNDDDEEEEETNRTLFLVCAVTLGRARDADDKEAANINSVCTSSFIKRLWGTKKM